MDIFSRGTAYLFKNHGAVFDTIVHRLSVGTLHSKTGLMPPAVRFLEMNIVLRMSAFETSKMFTVTSLAVYANVRRC